MDHCHGLSLQGCLLSNVATFGVAILQNCDKHNHTYYRLCDILRCQSCRGVAPNIFMHEIIVQFTLEIAK